ncbi:MAG: signal recognition particle protein Srp19 [Thermococcus sp.]|nr:signal recognition particle protein Srp19 [Thermococcus sp.]
MGKFIVWPSEIDARLPRKYGRSIRKDIAVEKPSIQEIVEAAESLGMKVIELRDDAMNPRLSGLDEEYRLKGMARIESPHGKTKSLKMISQKIREIRKTRTKHSKSGKHKSKRKKR